MSEFDVSYCGTGSGSWHSRCLWMSQRLPARSEGATDHFQTVECICQCCGWELLCCIL